MLWRARVTVQLRYLRVISSHFSAKPDIHSSPESKVDKDCVNFLPWLEKKAGVEISSNLYIGKSAHGSKCHQTPFPLLKTSLYDEVGNDSKLALVLLVEWKIQQVLIRYGKISNASLLLDYGFTLPYNIHDEVHFQISIPHHHFLSGTKLQMLERHLAPSTVNSNDIKFSGDSFIIKEVRSISRKGKGLPQSLRAFACVLSCNSPQDLSDFAVEAAQHDGRIARRPFEDRSREVVAHEILLSQINELIEEYNASIKSFGHFNPSYMRKTFALRKQMALDLLRVSFVSLNRQLHG